MAILPIYTYGQPVLRKRARTIKVVDDDLRRLVDNMLETMHRANGIGLAANQVGSLDRVIVVDISDFDTKEHEGVGEAANTIPQQQRSEHPGPIALINPEVVSFEGSWKMEEGCLSIPEIRDDVERPEIIKVKYNDLQLNAHALEASGLFARVILHEIDHLNGVLFIDRLGLVKQKLLRGRLNKIQKGLVEVKYPIFNAEAVEAQAK